MQSAWPALLLNCRCIQQSSIPDQLIQAAWDDEDDENDSQVSRLLDAGGLVDALLPALSEGGATDRECREGHKQHTCKATKQAGRAVHQLGNFEVWCYSWAIVVLQRCFSGSRPSATCWQLECTAGPALAVHCCTNTVVDSCWLCPVPQEQASTTTQAPSRCCQADKYRS